METANMVQCIRAPHRAAFLNDAQTSLEIDKTGRCEFFEKRCHMIADGKVLDEDGVLQFGEITVCQQRAILLREDWHPKTDNPIADFNFTDPVQSVFI